MEEQARLTLLHVKMARVIWLVDSADLNPRGLNLIPALEAVRERYGFQIYPESAEKMDEYAPGGIEFKLGGFQYQGQALTVAKAVLYGDGLVVETGMSTDVGEAFLSDVLTFLSDKYDMTYSQSMIHTRIYTSEMIVHSEKDMSHLFSPLNGIVQKLSSWTGQAFSPAGFGISIDTSTTSSKPAPFRFEREINKPHRQQRYYTAAPVQTAKHLELLDLLDKSL